MLTPFLVEGSASPQEINQSMVGVLTRLLTEITPGTSRYDVHLDVNLVSWPPQLVGYLVKALAVGLVALLAFFCRTDPKDRRDPRLLGEIALVALTMLFVSERSWKHHFVTLLLPYTYLVWEIYSPRKGSGAAPGLGFAIGAFVLADGHHVERTRGAVRRRQGARDRPGLWNVPVGRGGALRRGGLESAGPPRDRRPGCDRPGRGTARTRPAGRPWPTGSSPPEHESRIRSPRPE